MRASFLFLPHFPEKRLGRERREDTRISILLFGRNREVVNGWNRQEGINAKWEGIKGQCPNGSTALHSHRAPAWAAHTEEDPGKSHIQIEIVQWLDLLRHNLLLPQMKASVSVPLLKWGQMFLCTEKHFAVLGKSEPCLLNLLLYVHSNHLNVSSVAEMCTHSHIMRS